MTLEEFHVLCKKTWNEERGEPITLWLTESSYRELQDYAMENPVLYKEDGAVHTASRDVYSHNSPVPSHVGISLSTVVNPVTKNAVKLKLAREDAADIYTSERMYTKVLS